MTILRCKAILGRRQNEQMRRNLQGIMPQVQDRSLDMLICSPARYHCATTAPTTFNQKKGNTMIFKVNMLLTVNSKQTIATFLYSYERVGDS